MKRSKPAPQARKADGERKPARSGSRDQGIRKDQRGQEQPADKERAQRNR